MSNELPISLEINGQSYGIDPSFGNCIRIIEAYEDYELMDETKPMIMLNLLFNDAVDFTEDFISAAVNFLDGRDESESINLKKATEPKKRLFSFTQDMKFLRAAIQRTHGVNLRECNDMHWWKFLDMFLDLDPECMFCQIIHLRMQKQKGKLTKEEKKAWVEMRDILVLQTPDSLRAASESEELEAQLQVLENLAGGESNA